MIIIIKIIIIDEGHTWQDLLRFLVLAAAVGIRSPC